MTHFLRASIVLLLVSFSVNAERLNHYLDFYLGMDAQLRDMRFKPGFGDNLLKKRTPQGNIYAGVMLNDHAALELGYESTIERKNIATLFSGQSSAGVPTHHLVAPITYTSTTRIKGVHVGLVGFHALTNWPVKLIGGFGISSLKGTVERKTIQFSPMNIPSDCVRTFKKHKATFRFMMGAQYQLACGLGFRTTVSLIRTGKMIMKNDDHHPSIRIPMIKPKDSIVYGLGTFYVF